jgi:SAM-dependent methyltransferase
MSIDTNRLFSAGSEQYVAARPRYPRQLFEFICTQTPDFDRAWDCGTGSGQAAVALAERFGSVEATDVSPEQIANALPHDRVVYSVQSAEATTFPNASFSVVTVAQALHWFDFSRFWPEVHRVLRPGGLFAAWTYTWPHVTEEIDQIINTKLLSVIESFWMPQNRLAWDGYSTISFPFRELAPPAFIMSLSWNLKQFVTYLSTWSATRRCIDTKGRGFFEELSAALENEWGEPSAEREIRMEFVCRLGRHET